MLWANTTNIRWKISKNCTNWMTIERRKRGGLEDKGRRNEVLSKKNLPVAILKVNKKKGE